MNRCFHDDTTIPDRLRRLRAAMVDVGLDAYVVPSSDPHLSEYLPEHWQGRQWLSGFTGSVGSLVVTAECAGLWVDSRYWVQAQAQLTGTGIEMMRAENGAASAPYVDWLAKHIPCGGSVGVDGAVLSVLTSRAMSDSLSRRGIRLRVDLDLLDSIWQQRPPLSTHRIYEHGAPYACVSRREKILRIREAMRMREAQWHLISALDDIAWLLNLRGADVEYNPVFVAHMLLGLDCASLFVVDKKISQKLAESLASDGIRIESYDKISAALAALPAAQALLIDPRRTAQGIVRSAPASVRIIEAVNPSTLLKSRKTQAEIEHIRATMARDGAALAAFFAWFEGAQGRERITELTIDERITAARERRQGFVGPSFATIAAFGPNGAMPHYRATPASHSLIEGNGLLLIDSGGQYLDGTTDVTRVVPVGDISDAHRHDFTVVLKGVIALARARFPRGIRSPMLDAIARAPIWNAGLDYGHGTGHGVGYFLNVHEGPQSISYKAPADAWTAMEEGMVTSIEPGVYRPGKWGIRIENLALTRTANQTEFGDFLEFETLTLCPIDTRCIAVNLLSDEDRLWLNAYHKMVLERVSPMVSGDARAWLESRTTPI
ncbi:peptidase M24 [Pandoraea thiooxydans]|uniref:Peptidase M24 n=1 Tax=Pandoraea thiooxydans TaxID=445709 RepID=A0A0G3ERE9_9BURK|nr:aminopeptidase P family protein [Pandoraea thiooxydans]AKJ67291.1 peptidase M24 [Pandoraea thiooxydans]